MKKHFAWLVLAATIVLILGGEVHRSHAQTSLTGGFDALQFNLNAATLAGLPACSISGGCTGYVLLCNTSATGAVIDSQCVKLNASANWRTPLAYVVEQDTAATATVGASSVKIPVGTILVKPSRPDANVTP